MTFTNIKTFPIQYVSAETRFCIKTIGERVDRINELAKNKTELDSEGLKIVHNALLSGDVIQKINIVDFKKRFFKHLKADFEKKNQEGANYNLDLIIKKFDEILKIALNYEFQPIIDYTNKPVRLNQIYSTGENIPDYIKEFDHTAKHTMSSEEYLDIRISRQCQQAIVFVSKQKIKKPNESEADQLKNTELFIGPFEEMKAFYTTNGYNLIGKLRSKSSTQFYYFENPNNTKDAKVVVWGIANNSRLNHILLQLKFSGVDLNKVKIRGQFKTYLSHELYEFHSKLNGLKSTPDIVFIGNRSLIMLELAKRLNPTAFEGITNLDEEKKLTGELLSKYGYTTHEIGTLFKFSHVTLELGEKRIGFLACRMPNGNLAYNVSEMLFLQGTTKMIMVGAGGSLDKSAGVGSYQGLSQTEYGKDVIKLTQEQILKPEIKGLTLKVNRSNITVDSPLVENKEWNDAAETKGISSVDVETYHILNAMKRHGGKEAKILAGVFTSDVLGEHPLTQKIDICSAWQNLSTFCDGCFNMLNIPKGKKPPIDVNEMEKLVKKRLEGNEETAKKLKTEGVLTEKKKSKET